MPEEIKHDVVVKTQKVLGKFLHDVVHVVIKETGFLKGLYTEEELNSENVKEKEAKLAFLAKLIDAVKTITKTDLVAKPSKIVAGLEPTETNILLQTLAKALDKKLDSLEYVSQLKNSQIVKAGKSNKEKPLRKSSTDLINQGTTATTNKARPDKTKISPKEDKHQSKPKISPSSNETPKSTDRSKEKRSTRAQPNNTAGTPVEKKSSSKDRHSKEKDKPAKKDQKKGLPKETPIVTPKDSSARITEKLETMKEEAIVPNDNQETETPPIAQSDPVIDKTEEQNAITQPEIVDEQQLKKRTNSASRPKSARPKSGDRDKPVNKEKPIANVRPNSSLLRPPSVRPPSARPGAPRLRPDSAFPQHEMIPMGKINVIVENYEKDKTEEDDEETVVINAVETLEDQQGSNALIGDLSGDKGHLVEQILEQIQEGSGDNVAKPKVEIEWQDGKEAASKEIGNIRTLIQRLTKTANPLGKLLNYLHEDIEAMHTELQTWTTTKKQLYTEIEKQKKASAEMNKPLLNQLEKLNGDIRKLEEEIASTQGNILRNDVKIKDLLLPK